MVCSNCKQEGHRKTNCPCLPKAVVMRPKMAEAAVEAAPIALAADVREKFSVLTGLCVAVGAELGKGHQEAHYQQGLCVELQMAGIRHVAEEVMPILYKGAPLGGTCNARLDVMLHSFLPFIFELKAEPTQIKSKQHWQLVRYMSHKAIPYGAVVNFNQSDRSPLEIQFIVKDRDSYWLYDPVTQAGRPLVDYGLSLPAAAAAAAAAGGGGSSGSASESEHTSVSTEVEEWENGSEASI